MADHSVTGERAAASDGEQQRTPLRRFVRPIQQFIQTESAGGLVLVAAALVALIWANSPWSEAYQDLLATRLVVDSGFFRVDESLHFWVNDVAMVVFFFLVGMEIKHELAIGELRSLRRVAVPLSAALGGMVVPVALFLLIARDAEARVGWGIPMATDIAFALGVMALLGDRVSIQLKVLLLATAIFDDIGAVAVIAIFYTEAIEVAPLLLVFALGGAVWAANRAGVRQVVVYVLLGVAMWAATLESGVHPTVAGVVMGLLTPWRSWYSSASFMETAERVLARLRQGFAAPSEAYGHEQRTEALLSLSELSREAVAPVHRLLHGLHPWVAFAIVPVFAWANAGIPLGGGALGDAAGSPVTWAIAVGLTLGKPVGILAGWAVAARVGAEMSGGTGWRGVLGVGMLAGIGFTVSLFVTELAYGDAALLNQAKVGIVVASLLSGLAGYAFLRTLPGRSAED